MNNYYDVIVVGGGVAGIAASLSAAREGKKVLLIESSFQLGGLATSGLISIYLPLDDGEGHQICHGICEELIKLSISCDDTKNIDEKWHNANLEERRNIRYETAYNPHLFALLAERLLKESGVELLYGANVYSARVLDDVISSIDVATRTEKLIVSASSYIDCTGDATLCNIVGEKTVFCDKGNYLAYWYNKLLNGKNSLILKGTIDVNYDSDMDYPVFNGVNSFELSKVMSETHDRILDDFLKMGNEKEEYSLVTLPTIPQIRMSRRLVGKYELDINDYQKEFDDSLGMFSSWIHKGRAYQLPIGSLLCNQTKNLCVAGRCISVSSTSMWDVTRVIPVCAVSGEACGLIAAHYNDFSKIDVFKIQNILTKRKVPFSKR